MRGRTTGAGIMCLYGAVGRWPWGLDQGNGMGRSGPSCDWWAGIGLRGGVFPGNGVYGTQEGRGIWHFGAFFFFSQMLATDEALEA